MKLLRPGLPSTRAVVIAMSLLVLAAAPSYGALLLFRSVQELRASSSDLADRLSQIEARTADLANRPASRRSLDEARARLFFPELSETELALLSDSEVSTVPYAFPSVYTSRDYKEPSEQFSVEVVEKPDGPYVEYVLPNGTAVTVDPSLPSPRLDLRDIDTPYPEVSLEAPDHDRASEALYYFEFDVDETFSTPNFWRHPQLVPVARKKNLTSRRGLAFNLLLTTRRGIDGRSLKLRLPFRVTAMRLPTSWAALDFSELERHAVALGYGLRREDLITEFFNYFRSTYIWATDTQSRKCIDTFRAGLAACGAVNDLLGTFLELNGIRYRGVAGFNPVVRAIYPGGGHSAVEVLNPSTGRWEYLDSYLDIYLADVAAKDLRDHPEFHEIHVYDIKRNYRNGSFPPELVLGKLFKYRMYYDKRGRLPLVSMLQLYGNEEQYGMTWPMIQPSEDWSLEELFPEKTTVFVRARYLLSAHDIEKEVLDIVDKDVSEVVASPWTHASFELEPRRLLSTHTSTAEHFAQGERPSSSSVR